jgi:hypothetical protein
MVNHACIVQATGPILSSRYDLGKGVRGASASTLLNSSTGRPS